jgi:hypothetical protein
MLRVPPIFDVQLTLITKWKRKADFSYGKGISFILYIFIHGDGDQPEQ